MTVRAAAVSEADLLAELHRRSIRTARLVSALNTIGFYERHGYESSGPVANVLRSGAELPGIAFSMGL